MSDGPSSFAVHRSSDIKKGDRLTIGGGGKKTWCFGFHFWRWNWQFTIERRRVYRVTDTTDTTLTIKR